MKEPPEEPAFQKNHRENHEGLSQSDYRSSSEPANREKNGAVPLASAGDPRRAEVTQELLALTRERAMTFTSRNPLGPEPVRKEPEDDLEF